MFGLTDRGNKNKVNSAVWVILLGCITVGCITVTNMATICKELQTNEQLKRWLTITNRNFNETNE